VSYLLIDADDTLWENNIYFEQAFDDFVAFLDHSTLTPPQIRDVLNEIELANSKIHGYGSANFGRNLQEAYHHLVERAIRPNDLATIMSYAEKILEQPIELLAGVEDTLAELRERHHLILFTKGNADEQQMKVDRSGLGPLFHRTEIVKEKDAAAYRTMAERAALPLSETWMIGNSPKSDINPSLEAGLGAVLVPHDRTWVLERQELRLPQGARFHQVERFPDLTRLF
jgi:putative hydrolase of the HAD superfamily